jgi:hypothetical protein
MPQTPKQDPEILRAALIGLQHTLSALDQRIAELRSQLGGYAGPVKSTAGLPQSRAKRTMSAAARHRIALAQKKRWAAYNAAKAKPAAAKPPKRELSAEGRARIVAATKKRWATFRKAQQAPKPAAKAARKAPKPAAKKAPEAPAPVAAATPAAAPPATE